MYEFAFRILIIIKHRLGVYKPRETLVPVPAIKFNTLLYVLELVYLFFQNSNLKKEWVFWGQVYVLAKYKSFIKIGPFKNAASKDEHRYNEKN